MKVLIATGIFPPDIGGPARMIEQLSADLQSRGADIMILTFGKDDGRSRSYRVERASGRINFFWQILKMTKDVDIIYAFDLYTAGFLSWLVGKGIFGKKLVVRFAGDSAWESAQNKGYTTDDIITFQDKYYNFFVGLMKLVRGWILRKADKVVAVSQFMKHLAMKIGVSEEKIRVIYNSVDFVDLKNLDAETRELKNKINARDCRVILTGGRLVPWKGIDGVICAIAELKKTEFFPVKLIIIGDGPDRERLDNLSKKNGILDDVIFTGKIFLQDIFAYYNLADIFVLNSHYEGLSHMLLEALQLGKPVVASNCGGNSEIIEDGENGLLVNYNDTEKLAAAIKRVLTEEKWRASEYKNLCRESVKKFSWQNVVSDTISIFQEEIKTHG